MEKAIFGQVSPGFAIYSFHFQVSNSITSLFEGTAFKKPEMFTQFELENHQQPASQFWTLGRCELPQYLRNGAFQETRHWVRKVQRCQGQYAWPASDRFFGRIIGQIRGRSSIIYLKEMFKWILLLLITSYYYKLLVLSPTTTNKKYY